ncbi:MAG: peptidoglycan editing factor PgeF [Pseudomonadota bacterium]
MRVVVPPWAQLGGRLFGLVGALSTERTGGVSQSPYNGLNLGDHVGDMPAAVARNRASLSAEAALPADPRWLTQVHGSDVLDARDWQPNVQADGVVTRDKDQPLAIMTADCLPILLAATDASVVGAVHAGWRGLLDGVVANTIAAMDFAPGRIMAWIGPGISQAAFEVGDEVRDAFVAADHVATNCFVPNDSGRWQADLKMLALLALRECGVQRVTDSGLCTYGDAERFFSHRRSAPCGRMASLIWIR